MTAFRVTPRALEDLKNIGRYTLRKWGREQRDRYLRGLNRRFNWLAEHLGSAVQGRISQRAIAALRTKRI